MFFPADSELRQNGRRAWLLERKEARDRQEVARATSDYWQQQRLKKQAESQDDDGRTEVSIPGLVGIDQEYTERQQRQKVQLRQWLAQQQSEKAAEREKQKLEGESTCRLARRGNASARSASSVSSPLDFQNSRMTRIESPWTGNSCSFTWPRWTPGELWLSPRKTSIW